MWLGIRNFGATKKQYTKIELNEEEEGSRFMATCLSTGLKPTFGLKTANHGSDNLEHFLTAVGKTYSRRLSDADASNT